MSERVDCGGFGFDLPDGWAMDDDDEVTYSDPEQQPPITVTSPRGVLQLHTIAYDEDQLPAADPHEVEGLAADWGARRGAPRPLSATSGARADGAWAAAAYRLRDDFVEVWFLADGHAVLQASYVCPFPARDDEVAARAAVFASIRLA